MNNVMPRTTEIEALYPPRQGRAERYIWQPPTYADKAGSILEMVWCPQCGDWRERHHFYRNSARPNGLQSWCRRHDDTVNERVRAYRQRQRALECAAA